jgi:sugar lactone lactonase YvrE
VIRSLAIDPTTGFFYGATTSNLYRIDKSSGATTSVGPTSLPVDRALGFDAFGNLFGISGNTNLVSVDKSTGATSLIQDLGLQLDDLAADPATGMVYALGNGTPTYSLYVLNVTSGALKPVGPSLLRPAGMAFTNVPEPATWFLAAFALATIIAVRRGLER